MKHHHSRRELPTGRRAGYALRPVQFPGGLEVAGRKGVLLVLLDERTSKQRHVTRFFARKLCVLLEPVQGQGKAAFYLATGEPADLVDFASRDFVVAWEHWTEATRVDVLPLEDFSGTRQIRLAQPKHEAPRAPLPPLPACGWLNGK